MKRSELIEDGVRESQRKDFLAVGDQKPITFRTSKNLKDVVAEETRFGGLASWSLFATV